MKRKIGFLLAALVVFSVFSPVEIVRAENLVVSGTTAEYSELIAALKGLMRTEVYGKPMEEWTLNSFKDHIKALTPVSDGEQASASGDWYTYTTDPPELLGTQMSIVENRRDRELTEEESLNGVVENIRAEIRTDVYTYQDGDSHSRTSISVKDSHNNLTIVDNYQGGFHSDPKEGIAVHRYAGEPLSAITAEELYAYLPEESVETIRQGLRDQKLITIYLDYDPVAQYTDRLFMSGDETSPGFRYNDIGVSFINGELANLSMVLSADGGQEEDPVVSFKPMFRLYNPNSGEHFYTSAAGERDYLVSVGWTDEGEAWNAPELSGTPVFRLYNPNAGDHHYTINSFERDHLVSQGWIDEHIGWYSADSGSGQKIHRLYNPNCTGAGAHHYTANEEEAKMLEDVGWEYEGIGWYGVSATK